MGRPSRLLAPDGARMAVIEQQLAAMTLHLLELQARIEATRGPREAAMRRLYDLDHDQAMEVHLRAEFATADRAWQAAVEASRTAEEPAFALREEWLQLQVVRSFLPPCVMCEEVAGPVYLELGRDGENAALCLDCFDSWACDYDSQSGQRPPSHWLTVTAQEARERETVRRQEPAETPADAPSARPCWHCGGPVDNLDGWEATYAGDGTIPPSVALKVAAVVPVGTSPEVGEVCLLCLDRDLELFGRWKGIERDLCDPAGLRHERVLHRFVLDGTLPSERRRLEAQRRSGTTAPAPAVPRLPPALANRHAPPIRRSAGR
jgi:hypothetical protein